jgi:hypothetical protein
MCARGQVSVLIEKIQKALKADALREVGQTGDVPGSDAHKSTMHAGTDAVNGQNAHDSSHESCAKAQDVSQMIDSSTDVLLKNLRCDAAADLTSQIRSVNSSHGIGATQDSLISDGDLWRALKRRTGADGETGAVMDVHSEFGMGNTGQSALRHDTHTSKLRNSTDEGDTVVQSDVQSEFCIGTESSVMRERSEALKAWAASKFGVHPSADDDWLKGASDLQSRGWKESNVRTYISMYVLV